MRLMKVLMIFALCSVIAIGACKKDDNSSSSSSTATNSLQQGNWRITKYVDSGTDELYHFAGYTFTFSGGIITGTRSGSTVTGTYSSGTDDSQKKLYLAFGSVSPFEELNEDWHILEETSTLIRLEHVSGGNGGTDWLTFEKN